MLLCTVSTCDSDRGQRVFTGLGVCGKQFSEHTKIDKQTSTDTAEHGRSSTARPRTIANRPTERRSVAERWDLDQNYRNSFRDEGRTRTHCDVLDRAATSQTKTRPGRKEKLIAVAGGSQTLANRGRAAEVNQNRVHSAASQLSRCRKLHSKMSEGTETQRTQAKKRMRRCGTAHLPPLVME